MTIQSSGEPFSPEQAKAIIRNVGARGANAPSGTLPVTSTGASSIKYEDFKTRHPSYDAGYWEELDALYEGGKRLLADPHLMTHMFPMHRNEQPEVYEERKKRAFYVSYAGEIIDHLIAELFTQPLQLEVGKDEVANWPDYYQDMFDDCSAPKGELCSFNKLLSLQMKNALICRTAWAMTEMPPAREFDSQKTQEAAGALKAYVVPVHPASVIDWEEDDTGELQWLMMLTEVSRRDGIQGKRNMITKRFMFYTAVGWEQWEITHKAVEQPKDRDPVVKVNEGTHGFKKVPFCRMTLPAGLWAMNKLHSLAREHFNKRNALAWAEFQSLFQELYEFLAAEQKTSSTVGENQTDANRATNDARGQGYVQKRGGDDSAMFIGPTEAPFEHALNSCKEQRDEMHRVTYRMALTVDNSDAALRRSGKSKEQDRTAMRTILAALGKLVRDHAVEILKSLSIARGEDALAEEWKVEGLEQFDTVSLPDEIESGLSLQEIEIPSPTFRKAWLMDLVKAKLGDKVSPEDLDTIEKELDAGITADSMSPVIEIDEVIEEGGEGNRPNVEDSNNDPAKKKDQPMQKGKRVLSKSPGMK